MKLDRYAINGYQQTVRAAFKNATYWHLILGDEQYLNTRHKPQEFSAGIGEPSCLSYPKYCTTTYLSGLSFFLVVACSILMNTFLTIVHFVIVTVTWLESHHAHCILGAHL